MRRALALAGELGSIDEPTSSELLAMLREPFAVRALDKNRTLEAMWIAQGISGPVLCAEAWGALEPHVPWDRETLTARRDCYQRTLDVRRGESARDLGRFLGLARRGRPYDKPHLTADVAELRDQNMDALKAQQLEHMERGLDYCRTTLGLGARWRG
jgi:hypothetical protein